ncbi:CDP-glycerol glycerophosphotransferase family protein [Arthrobacter sp. I2-34]|uniref:CDP-glycerol glycerophosphotransferase family protein n=1 Tax=Arthrobacter hankyongi TaxID=2904801 RepID=A0ABS9L6K7_9MICC|nr:CDP-glycerol glycerophosphotransferase family protein [Arthrobacter hankyongi]MCG2622265.1 CDP-glycerol glycerophosphotransferase family protein [Arthrobacter hankyongi]
MKAALRTVLPRTAGAVVLGAGAGFLAASFALQGSAGVEWVLLGGIGTALSIMLVPVTQRVLAVHHVTAYGLPGIKLPAAPQAWVPSVLAGASLLGTAAILNAGWSVLWWILWLAAIGAAMAGVGGYAFWLARQRGRRWPAVQRALGSFGPEFLIYTGRKDGGAYQIEQWLGPLKELGVPFAVVTRHNEAADALRRRPALAGIPLVACLNTAELDKVIAPTVRATFYVNSVASNINMVSYRHLTHVYLGHGDSDKEISAHPVHAMYDRIFVAGQAAIERYHANNVLIPEEKFAVVGRPQLRGAHKGPRQRTPDEAPTVLYAPTWLGYNNASTLSSLEHAGPYIQRLLSRGARIIFRPHPFSVKSAEERRLVAAVDEELRRHGGPHMASGAARSADLVELFNASDALVTDVSSVLVDYTVTGKPIGVIAWTNEDLAERYPSLRAAQLMRSPEDAEVLLDAAERSLNPLSRIAAGYQSRSECFETTVREILATDASEALVTVPAAAAVDTEAITSAG